MPGARVAILRQLLRLRGQRAALQKQFRAASAGARGMSPQKVREYNVRFSLLRGVTQRLEDARAGRGLPDLEEKYPASIAEWQSSFNDLPPFIGR